MRLGLLFGHVFAVAVLLLSNSAWAEKRVALVIGNSGYQKVAKLKNPLNDAAAVGAVFTAAGFEVVDVRQELDANALRRAIRDFSLAARDADVAVVFYAGHGIEFEGNNYLVPIDARLEWDVDIDDESISLDRVLKSIEPAKRLRLVILDACRDNPFVASMKRTLATRSMGRGLAKIEPMTSDTLVAFAAKAGSTAEDGSGPHSPFTTALLKHLPAPGLDVRFAFGRVRDEVMKSTRSKQEPAIYGSLGGDTISIVPALPEPPRPRVPDPDELTWNFIRDSSDASVLKQFVEKFPASPFRAEAEARIAALAARVVPPPSPPPAEIAWDFLKDSRDAGQLRRFAEQFPNSTRRADAEQRIAALKADAALKAEAEQRAIASKAAEAPQEVVAAPAPQVASLSPAREPLDAPALRPPPLSRDELVQKIKTELKRVGCYMGRIDGKWSNAETTASVERFLKHADLPATSRDPDATFLETVLGRAQRVCPLQCGARQVEANGHCVAKTCPGNLVLNDKGDCERPAKKRVKAVSRTPAATPTASRSATPAEPASGGFTGGGATEPVGGRGRWKQSKVTAGGQTACGPKGCQRVPKGCVAVRGTGGGGLGGRIFCPGR